MEFINLYFPEYYFKSFKNAILKFENLSNTIYNFYDYINEVEKIFTIILLMVMKMIIIVGQLMKKYLNY